jgi:hypothetical protein
MLAEVLGETVRARQISVRRRQFAIFLGQGFLQAIAFPFEIQHLVREVVVHGFPDFELPLEPVLA